MSEACFLVTFRDAGEGRRENLLTVLDWYAPLENCEFLVVEQDSEPRLGAASLPPACRRVFAYNPGPFNKSWGFNIGSRLTGAPVLILADADVLVDVDVVQACITECNNRYEAMSPYQDLVDLSAAESRLIRAGDLSPLARLHPRDLNRRRQGEVLCFCGGMYLVRREVYERLGGQDERFEGWGGEDDAMSRKLLALVESVAVNRSRAAWHLHHERNLPTPENDGVYSRNLELLSQYDHMDRAALGALADSQRENMGRLDRFREVG